MKVVSMILLGMILALALTGCTTIQRKYDVFLYAWEESIIEFPVDVLNEINKDTEIESKADVSASPRFPLIPVP